MIIYQEIIAGARQPNVLQMTAVVTENVTSGVTLLVTYDVTFSDTMKPYSTNCNSDSCERDHLEGVTSGVKDGVTGDVTGNQGDRFLILLAIYGQPGIKNIVSCFLQKNGFTPFNKITRGENVSKTPSP